MPASLNTNGTSHVALRVAGIMFAEFSCALTAE